MNRRIEYALKIGINIFRFILLRLMYGSKIKCSGKLIISPRADIKITNKGRIELGKICNVEKNSQIRSTGGYISVGNNVYINRNCNIVSHKSIVIDDNVTIGPNVCIFDHDHNFRKKESDEEYISKEIIIGHGTWIGANCIITKGVSIGANCVIAAGTIVTKNIPDNMIIRSKVEYVIGEIRG